MLLSHLCQLATPLSVGGVVETRVIRLQVDTGIQSAIGNQVKLRNMTRKPVDLVVVVDSSEMSAVRYCQFCFSVTSRRLSPHALIEQVSCTYLFVVENEQLVGEWLERLQELFHIFISPLSITVRKV